MKRSYTRSGGRPRGCRILLGLCLVGLACDSGEPPPYEVDVAVSPTPPIVGPARVIVMVERPGGGPLPGATVTVEGQTEGGPMVQMKAAPEGPGLYTVDAFPFGRPGDWRVVVTAIHVSDGVVDTVAVERNWTVSGR